MSSALATSRYRRDVEDVEHRVQRTVHLLLKSIWLALQRSRGSVSATQQVSNGGTRQRREPLSKMHELDFARKSRVLYRLAFESAHQRVTAMQQQQQQRGSPMTRRGGGDVSLKSSGGTSHSQRRRRGSRSPANGGNQGLGRNAAAGGDEEVAVLALRSSASVLLLTSTLPAMLAQLFLRRLRWRARRRKELLSEIQLRYEYYRQRRVLRAWQEITSIAGAHRYRVLSGAVGHWIEWTKRRHATRGVIRHYVGVVRLRLSALAQFRRRHLGELFHAWQRCFDRHRSWRHMDAEAQQFRRRYAPQHYISFDDASQAALSYAASGKCALRAPLIAEAVTRRVLRHWRQKTERRLDCRCADLRCRMRLLGRTFATLLQRLKARNALSDSPPPRGRPRAVVGQGLAPTVYLKSAVPHASEQVCAYKLSCAVAMWESMQRRVCFLAWHRAWQSSMADRYFIWKTRSATMKRWANRASRRRVVHRILQCCWIVWRSRTSERRDNRVAAAVHRHGLLGTAWRVWRDEHVAQCHYRRHLSATVLEHMAMCVAVARAKRALARGRVRRALLTWKVAVDSAVQERTMEFVAETIREMVLQVRCIRRWRCRCAERRQIAVSLAILSDIRAERRRAACFLRWRSRTAHRRGDRTPPAADRLLLT